MVRRAGDPRHSCTKAATWRLSCVSVACQTCHRVGRRLPVLQDDVCVLGWPPAFAAVPQDLVHAPVVLLPLSEQDKRLSQTSGSSMSHSARARRHDGRAGAGLPRATSVMGSGGTPTSGPDKPFRLSMSGQWPPVTRSLHSADVSPFTGDSNVGTFTPRGLAASSLGHCGTPVPISGDVAVPHPLFTLRGVLGVVRGKTPQEPERRSPGYLPVFE